jgi:hypothetical protein
MRSLAASPTPAIRTRFSPPYRCGSCVQISFALIRLAQYYRRAHGRRLGERPEGAEAIRVLEKYALCKLKPSPYFELELLYSATRDPKKSADLKERGVAERDPDLVFEHVRSVRVRSLLYNPNRDSISHRLVCCAAK